MKNEEGRFEALRRETK